MIVTVLSYLQDFSYCIEVYEYILHYKVVRSVLCAPQVCLPNISCLLTQLARRQTVLHFILHLSPATTDAASVSEGLFSIVFHMVMLHLGCQSIQYSVCL